MLDSYLAKDRFELVHYQYLLSLDPRPGSRRVSPSWVPGTKDYSGTGHGSGEAGCLGGRSHWKPQRPVSWKDILCFIPVTEKVICACNIGVHIHVCLRDRYIYHIHTHICICIYIYASPYVSVCVFIYLCTQLSCHFMENQDCTSLRDAVIEQCILKYIFSL